MDAWKYQIYFSCWTCLLHIERVEHLVFNTQNKSGISAHPRIILSAIPVKRSNH
jgi:hypothetical protein